MDQQDLVDLWVTLDRQIKDLSRQQATVEAALGLASLPSGTELKGRQARIRVQDRAVLKDDKLEQRVTAPLWRRITKRVVVADLLKAEIQRGKIDATTVKECSGRSKPWFKTIV